MGRMTMHVSAMAAACLTFAVTGGIQASERAMSAVRDPAAPVAARAGMVAGIDAQIPFANNSKIRGWRPDGADALYVQDGHGRWYRAALIQPCVDLPTAHQLAFLTRGADVFDKFSAISAGGQRYGLSAFVTSAAPPRRVMTKPVITKG